MKDPSRWISVPDLESDPAIGGASFGETRLYTAKGTAIAPSLLG
jgi:hypothetical protein